MAEYPEDLRYTSDHEWVRFEGERARVGITDYAQEALGDIVYVSLPRNGQPGRGGRRVRRDRVDQERQRRDVAGQRDRRGRELRTGRRPGGGQQRPVRRRLDVRRRRRTATAMLPAPG